MSALCEQHAQPYPLPTYAVDTPSGGCHLYYGAPEVHVRNSAGRLGPQIDVRADGGYVIGSGSRVGERAYTAWDERVPVPLPAWIAGLLEGKPPLSMSGGDGSGWAWRAGNGVRDGRAARGNPAGRHRPSGNPQRHAQPRRVQPRPACRRRAAPSAGRRHRTRRRRPTGGTTRRRDKPHDPLGDDRRCP
jgi:hypothetical protein